MNISAFQSLSVAVFAHPNLTNDSRFNINKDMICVINSEQLFRSLTIGTRRSRKEIDAIAGAEKKVATDARNAPKFLAF